jgi:Fe-S-cluster-containing dehydrogenase component
MKIERKTFLTGLAAAGTAAVLPKKRAEAAVREDAYATLIDVTKCDGCESRLDKNGMPQCVAACRSVNAEKFPEPDKKMLKPYWPQKKYEDWSSAKKRKIFNRLTPYNWTFVQKALVKDDKGNNVTLNIPRRCMHCDNPPCVKLCPFGAMKQTGEGTTYVDLSTCFGGAKCRTVCPWDVPQRQAGVGFYRYLDPLPVGGGAMFKCDLCRDPLAKGEKPGCVSACPNNAITIGTRKEIFKLAEDLKKKYNGYIYGEEENGGTSTRYVSKVPFEKIDKALAKKPKPGKKGRIMRFTKAESMLESYNGLSIMTLIAPLAGAVGAFAATMKSKEKNGEAANDS